MRYKSQPFVDKFITGDEKWILYENPLWSLKRKKVYCKPVTSASIIAKRNLHQRKGILCLWWDRKGPLYYELLKQGQTIKVITYCNQLDKLNAAIKEKRSALANGKGIILHHDNAKPHTSLVTQQKLNELGWEDTHPPYSPDTAPSDYHLFRSLQKYLMGGNLLFSKLSPWRLLNTLIPSMKWQRVIANNGCYIID